MLYSLIQKSNSLIKKHICLSILCFSVLTQHHMAFTQGDELEALSPHTEFIQKFILDHLMQDSISAFKNIRVIKNLLEIDNYKSWPVILDYIENDFSNGEIYEKLIKVLSPPKQNIISLKQNTLRDNFEKSKIIHHVTLADLLELRVTLQTYKNSLRRHDTFFDKLKITKSPSIQLLRKISYQFNQLVLHTDFMMPNRDLIPPLSIVFSDSTQTLKAFEFFLFSLEQEQEVLLFKLLIEELIKSIDLRPIHKKTLKENLNFKNLFSFYKNLHLNYFKNLNREGYLPLSELYYVTYEKILEIKNIVPLTSESFKERYEEILSLFDKEDPIDSERIAYLLAQFISTFQFAEVPQEEVKFIGKIEYYMIHDLIIKLQSHYQKLCRLNAEISRQFIKHLFDKIEFFIIHRSEKLNLLLKEDNSLTKYSPSRFHRSLRKGNSL
jgi:hypothetical protein